MPSAGSNRISDHCETHRENYPPRSPDYTKMQNSDENHQIDSDDGLFEFAFPAPAEIIFGEPPFSDAEVPKSEVSKYLWVVASDAVPGALERHPRAIVYKRGSLTHTNLTGGADAHTAGELWFRDTTTVMINGGSSRYTPRGPKELLSVAEAFKSAGFEVANLGWDKENNIPWRIQTENMTWLSRA